MKGSCHCGAVAVEVPGPPDYLNQCNCTVCFKLGALWGYYPGDAVKIAGATLLYSRGDVDQPKLRFHFCGACGATTHWSSSEDPAGRMGVNMRLFEPVELSGVGVLYGDRRSGAQGERRFWREPTRFDGGPIA